MDATAELLRPVLTGARVVVRPVRPEDWDGMFAAAADPAVWAQHPESDRHLEPVFRRFFDGALACGSGFAIADRKSGTIIGSSRYHGHDPDRREIEIGWTFLAVRYWGGGYNLEIKKLMLDHAFRFVDTAVFWVGMENLRSRRAVEKIGGSLRAESARRPGEPAGSPHAVYEIRKADYRL